MALDPKNSLTFTSLFAAKSQATNNTASTGMDLKEYEGPLAVRVNVGVQTAGDNASTFTLQLQDSATNAAANATNVSGGSVVTTGNNAATFSSTIQVDPRARLRYLFGRIIIAGANSPAAPIAVEVIGQKQVQS